MFIFKFNYRTTHKYFRFLYFSLILLSLFSCVKDLPQKPTNYDDMFSMQVVDSAMMAIFTPPCDSFLVIGKVFKEGSFNQTSELSMSYYDVGFDSNDFEIKFRANIGDEIFITIQDVPYLSFGRKNYILSPENSYWNKHAKILYLPYTMSGGYYFVPAEENTLYTEFTDSALIFSFCDLKMEEASFGEIVLSGKLIYYFEE